MPAVTTKMTCPFCGEYRSRKTVRRHARTGCTAAQREALRVNSALQRLVNPEMTLAPQRPKKPRTYHRRKAPPSPPPVPPRRPRSPPPQPNPPSAPPEQQNVDRNMEPGNPVEEEFNALLRDLPRHPDFRFDTPGAGPSCLANPLDRPPDFPPRVEDDSPNPVPLAESAPWLSGLTAEAILQKEIDAQIARSGGHKLSDSDLLTLRAFNFKVDTGITARAFGKLPRAFPELDELPTMARTKTRVATLAGIQGVKIDCCINSCIAYTGHYEAYRECPHCTETRYEPDPDNPDRERSKRTFSYIPLIPRLINLYRDREMATKLGYRGRYQSRPGVSRDIFDGAHYQRLLGKSVWTLRRNFTHKYFSMPTDIALGLSTDGFGPFKTRKQSCWPLILFNYNLPPSLRFKLEHIICLGIVPGPAQPKEIGTFLQPLIDELEDLAAGVPAWDSLNERAFCLRAYLIVCFGDMPAVAKMMCMKGPGGKVPCRACRIVGVLSPENSSYYACLRRCFADNPTPYDPLNLPRRTHRQYVDQASQVDSSPNDTMQENRSRRFGINSLSPLSDIPSLDFPTSFPHDFMHLMFENVLPTLFALWTHSKKFSDFGTGHEDYILDPKVWEAIGAACAASGDTIPSIFGCRVPNLSDNKFHVTAEARLIFATLLAPAFLHGQFKRPKYYRHYMKLVRLISLCLAFEISEEEVREVREGFASWVQEYEEIYYREKPDRLRACTLPIHALLHVADDIQAMGPVWCYWAFPMERFCGALAHANKNFRFIWASLDRHVLEIAQLSQIKLIYGLTDTLSLEDERYNIATGTRYNAYPGLVFVRPMKTTLLHSTIIKKVAKYVSDVMDVDERIVRDAIRDRRFVVWGRMQQVDEMRGGDLIRGHHLSPCRERVSRDAAYVKYYTRLSRWGRTNPRELDHLTFGYGRAELFAVIDTDFLQTICDQADKPNLRLDPLVLAAVSPIPTFKKVSESGMVRYNLVNGKLATPEIIDVKDVDCLIGRARTSDGDWYIIDRTTIVGRLHMLESMVDPT